MKMMIMMDQSISGSHTIVKPSRYSDYQTTLPQSAKPHIGNRTMNLFRSKSSQPESNQFR